MTPDTLVPDGTNPQHYNRYAYVGNNPVNRKDPSGHCTRSFDGEGEFCDPLPPPPPTNPWVLTDEMLDLNGDGEVGLKEALVAEAYYQSQAERIFLAEMENPVNAFGSFGECNTVRGGCPDYHPSVDSSGVAGGASVGAAGYGRVVAVGEVPDNGLPNFGNYVVVEHNVYGVLFYTVYAHLASQSVEVGDIVDAGSEIGTVGDTYNQDNEHLHFEIRKETNVDLSQEGNALFLTNYWANTDAELHSEWIDMGPRYGYDSDYPATWTQYPMLP